MTNDYRTLVAPAARNDLRRVPRPAALRILKRLLELEADPYGFSNSDPVPMTTEPGRRVLRIGDHYVVYTVEHGHVIVWVVSATSYRAES